VATILIAEDEKDIRDLITFLLQLDGHQVIATANGADAYLQAQVVIPDLILLDVQMPKMTGYEACKKIKETELTQDIPILFLSAKEQELEVNQDFEAGAMDFLGKPFSTEQLTEKVASILSQQRK
jgi:CheY-like chemotaxis protein